MHRGFYSADISIGEELEEFDRISADDLRGLYAPDPDEPINTLPIRESWEHAPCRRETNRRWGQR